MGNLTAQYKRVHSISDTTDRQNENNYQFLKVLMIFQYGKIWLTKGKDGEYYVVKEMYKDLINYYDASKLIKNELKFLKMLNHKFIVKIKRAFQDDNCLYLALQYYSGGPLQLFLDKKKKFTENEAKFITACLILSLEYIHSQGIVHGSICPKNIILDSEGYAKLSNFGYAKFIQDGKIHLMDDIQDPTYQPLEVLLKKPIDYTIDFYLLGVLLYEIMINKKIFELSSIKEIREKLMLKQIQIKKSDLPEEWSIEAADFINKLLQRKPEMRLGFQGINQLRLHVWFRSFPWQKLEDGFLKAYFIPPSSQRIKQSIDANSLKEMNKIREKIKEQKINVKQLDFEDYVYP